MLDILDKCSQKVSRSTLQYCSCCDEIAKLPCCFNIHAAMQGLWGPGSPFTDFKAFLDSMKSRGVSFLEMLAMEMKSEGYYVARGLSFTYGCSTHGCDA